MKKIRGENLKRGKKLLTVALLKSRFTNAQIQLGTENQATISPGSHHAAHVRVQVRTRAPAPQSAPGGSSNCMPCARICASNARERTCASSAR